MILKVLILPIYCRIMANQLQLQRQIQEEIDREAKIDRLIESKLKRFLKHTKNLKQVYRQEDCDAIMIFDRDDLTSVHTFYIDDPKEEINFPDRSTIFFLKIKTNTILNYTNILIF